MSELLQNWNDRIRFNGRTRLVAKQIRLILPLLDWCLNHLDIVTIFGFLFVSYLLLDALANQAF